MSYRELKNFFPVVFGRPTTSNNKQWIHKALKEHFSSVGRGGGRAGPGARPAEPAAVVREAMHTPWPCAAPAPAPLRNITNSGDGCGGGGTGATDTWCVIVQASRPRLSLSAAAF